MTATQTLSWFPQLDVRPSNIPSLGFLFLPHTADTKGPESTSISFVWHMLETDQGVQILSRRFLSSSEELHESHDYKMSASSPGRAAAVTTVTFFFLQRTPILCLSYKGLLPPSGTQHRSIHKGKRADIANNGCPRAIALVLSALGTARSILPF